MTCIVKLEKNKAKRVNSKDCSPYVDALGEYKGYEYLVVLTKRGHRCGYVAISEDHPLYNKKDESDINIDMHGGCTFFNYQFTDSNCTDKWIGFDCAHLYDAKDIDALRDVDPAAADIVEEASYGFDEGLIRTNDYCVEQCKGIIDQLVLGRG